MTATLSAPFPYFGGKRGAAPLIWQALGDPGGYVEPFAGSAAVLLARPPFEGRRVETLNDADGWLVNAWRAIRLSPGEVAEHASGPVTEIDYHARLAWLQSRRDADLVAWLEGDPEHHDAKAAGWWLYVMACGIGSPWDGGPWRVVDGHLRKIGDAGRGVNRELPHLGNAGRGVNRELPHRGDAGDALAGYMAALAVRLRRVRITCGDWRRVVTSAVYMAGAGNGTRAVFLDPPYTGGAYVYAKGTDDIAREVGEWCARAPAGLRVVVAGRADWDGAIYEPLMARGWREERGVATTGGYGGVRHADTEERLWMSPACLDGQLRLGLDA